ncbi:hypothetical protein O181_116471 [Austropuccinia psidii MF-1]|uniref:Uncharacterized protein n=1 Tax=Austropuccinia psidii MF-1 TaxID=1389203 RepID=A0A9Q3PX35_9BASI|nr:hypothetical protein [Austropuccinia psidii MF-1]
MGVAAIHPGTQLGPIGHTISFIANYPPLAIAPSPGLSRPQAISCHHWPYWPTSISPALRPLSLFWGLGVSFCLLEGSGPTSPQGQVGLKQHLGPPEPFLAPNPIKTLRTHFGQGPPWTTFQPMASGSSQRPPDQLSNPSPQLKGDFSHSSMHPILKVAGVVHILYYIPLCTIFAQQFNGDAVGTPFGVG